MAVAVLVHGPVAGLDRQEEVAVPHGLGEDEHRVERQRRDGGEGELGPENSGPGSAVVKRGSTRVRPASATTVASADPVPSGLKTARWCLSAPDQQARPTMPLMVIITAANTVSRASAEVSCRSDHQRDDQRHLDDRHRDREQQRAERLTDPVRHHLGVVHRGEDGADQEDADAIATMTASQPPPPARPPSAPEQDQRRHRTTTSSGNRPVVIALMVWTLGNAVHLRDTARGPSYAR